MILTHADARDAISQGRSWLGFLRRAGPALAVGAWADLSYAAGIPVANYYASTPLVGAALATRDGIDIGPTPAAGMRKYLKRALLMPPTATGLLTIQLIDTCLYYPFIDGDGGYQELVQSDPVGRYDGGDGCRIMVVSQGVGTAAVDVRVTYTDSLGVAGRQVTATLNLAAGAGSLCSSSPPGVTASKPCGPFLPLAAGTRGVRSVEAVEPLTPGGGIAAYCIVRPLASFGMQEATAAPVEVDFLADLNALPRIDDGAYLSAIARGTIAAAPATLHLHTETIWG